MSRVFSRRVSRRIRHLSAGIGWRKLARLRGRVCCAGSQDNRHNGNRRVSGDRQHPNGALLIDVREETELKAGHVPGTVNVSRGRLEFRIWKQLGYPGPVEMNRKIYVQCATGGRATLAARQLKDIGFTNVTAVVMELADWQKKGHPFVKDGSK